MLGFKNRLRVKINKFFSLFLIVLLLVCSFSFDSNAAEAENVYKINMSEPSKEGNNGYCTLLLRNESTGVTYVTVLFWHMYFDNQLFDEDLYMDIDVTSGYVYFYCRQSCTVFSISSDGKDSPSVVPTYSSDLYDFRINLPSNITLLGCNFYGNYGNVNISANINNYANNWDVLFVADALEIDLLNKIYRCVDALVKADSDIDGHLLDILDSCEDMSDYITECVSYLNSINNELLNIGISLDEINSLYDDLLTQQITMNNYLKNMYNTLTNSLNQQKSIASSNSSILSYLKKMFYAEGSSSIGDSQFNNNMDSKSDELDALNEQNEVVKLDVDDTSEVVDSAINFDSMAEYSGVVGSITTDERLLPFFLVVFSIALIGFVLFGKR